MGGGADGRRVEPPFPCAALIRAVVYSVAGSHLAGGEDLALVEQGNVAVRDGDGNWGARHDPLIGLVGGRSSRRGHRSGEYRTKLLGRRRVLLEE